MLSSPLIVFTDNVTHRHIDGQTKVITMPHHKICEGVIMRIQAIGIGHNRFWHRRQKPR